MKIKFYFKKLCYILLLLLAVITLNFILIQLAPGDIVQTLAGEMGGMSPELMEELRRNFNLDKSLFEQLLTYIAKIAQGDLGYSYFYNQPVIELILDRVGPTILLVFSSLFISVIIGTFLGVYTSQNSQGFLSNVITIITLAGWSMPVFFGLVLCY